MKIAGIVLVWVGVLMFLKNIDFIQVINWSVVWPILLIILGASLKHFKHSMMCAVGGNCGACGVGDAHKCEGAECGMCKK